MNFSSFRIKKSALLAELQKMTKALGARSKWNCNTELELTVTDGLLTLVIPGVRLEVPCLTNSTAKAAVGLFYFTDIIATWSTSEIDCIIKDHTITVGVTSFRAKTTFFETDSILRSMKLPINYTDLHLLQLEYNGFTPEEISFNNLEREVSRAKRNLTTNIRKAYELLGVYGMTRQEVEALVREKIERTGR